MTQINNSIDSLENPFISRQLLDVLSRDSENFKVGRVLVPNTRFVILNSITLMPSPHVLFIPFDGAGQELLNQRIQEFMAVSGDTCVQILSSGIASLSVCDINPPEIVLRLENDSYSILCFYDLPLLDFLKSVLSVYDKMSSIKYKIEISIDYVPKSFTNNHYPEINKE